MPPTERWAGRSVGLEPVAFRPVFGGGNRVSLAMLENIANVLAHNHNPDELHASVQLKGLPTHLHASCTTRWSSHARAFDRSK